MSNVTLWKNKFALHCPDCDNVYNLEWLDGSGYVGKAIYRCPECLCEFTATGKLFKTNKEKHGRLSGNPYSLNESLNGKARRMARE